MTCPGCGERYDEFRTGETFASVRRMLRGRRYVRRRGVLGFWHELKQSMWQVRHGYCRESKVA